MKRITLTTVLAAAAVGALAVLAATPPANLPEALAVQRQLVAERPGDAAAHNDLGNLLLLAGDPAGAEEAYRRAVELSSEVAAYHYNLGLLLQQRGALRPARAAYLEVLRLEPGNAWAHFHLGTIAEARGQERRAIERYGEALRLDPHLAFPDVNPAVIESALLTEAMLHGYREGAAAAPRAPRVYADPARITALLLPTPEPGAATEPEAGDAEAEAPRELETGPGGTRGAGGASLVPRRVLTEDDLGEGTVNQAAPGVGGGTRYRPSEREPSQVRTWNQPGVIAAPAPSETPDGRAAGPAPRQREIVPRGQELVPTLPSTGRLDLYLRGEGPTERAG